MMMNRGFALWLVLLLPTYACGDEVTDEGGRGGSGNPAALEAACEDYCVASSRIDCGGQQLSEAQCRAGCPVLGEQLGGFCIAEYTAVFECGANGDFECFEEQVIPTGACTSVSLALATCIQALPCKQFCAAAVDAGCGGTDIAACEAQCEADLEDYEELGSCDFEYEDVLTCMGREGVTCVDGVATSDACTEDVLEMGDCLGRDDLCEGWCWASERAACGSEDCTTQCETAASDERCSSAHEQLLRCTMRGYDATCEAGTITSQDCDSQQSEYDACTEQM